MQLALIDEERRTHQIGARFAFVDRNTHIKRLREVAQEFLECEPEPGMDLIVCMQELIDHAEGVRDNEQIRLREEAAIARLEGAPP